MIPHHDMYLSDVEHKITIPETPNFNWIIGDECIITFNVKKDLV